jgi:hypothetical protein
MERGKTKGNPMIQILDLTEEEKRMCELQHKELEIESLLKGEPKLIEGKLDYTVYDELMSSLREVRAEMASLIV